MLASQSQRLRSSVPSESSDSGHGVPYRPAMTASSSTIGRPGDLKSPLKESFSFDPQLDAPIIQYHYARAAPSSSQATTPMPFSPYDDSPPATTGYADPQLWAAAGASQHALDPSHDSQQSWATAQDDPHAWRSPAHSGPPSPRDDTNDEQYGRHQGGYAY